MFKSKSVVSDSVNHPDHYQGQGIEVIDIIDSFDLDFYRGNIVKYILRADKKGNEIKDSDIGICCGIHRQLFSSFY